MSAACPTPRSAIQRPGDVLYRLRQQRRETSDEAIARAAKLPWWPKVRNRKPVWAAGFWCWGGEP